MHLNLYVKFLISALSLRTIEIYGLSPPSSTIHVKSPWKSENGYDRRFCLQTFGTVFLSTFSSASVSSADESNEKVYSFETRNRNRNKNALIRDDIFYFSGQIPPRKIDLNNLPPGPKWNAWGTCSNDSSTGNSCTYVSIKQKIPAYSNYAFTISLASKEFKKLGDELKRSNNLNDDQQTSRLLKFVSKDSINIYPPVVIDSQLKMVLLATALLTSPNYSGPPFDLLIARYYVNEFAFSTSEMADALMAKDLNRAIAAYEYGKDSFNSYFIIVNKAIVPKVGEKFEMID